MLDSVAHYKLMCVWNILYAYKRYKSIMLNLVIVLNPRSLMVSVIKGKLLRFLEMCLLQQLSPILMSLMIV